MSGDLSLSGALGGLRIANPDEEQEEAVLSPITSTSTPAHPSSTQPPPPSSHSSDTITQLQQPALLPGLSHASPEEENGSLGFNPNTYAIQEDVRPPISSQQYRPPNSPIPDDGSQTRRLAHRQSLPLNYQAQQQMQYPVHSSNYNQQMRNPGPLQTSFTRPTSGMYQLPNTSSSSQSSYRYRDELGSSHSGMSGLERHGSTSARNMLGGQVPQRQSSRSYRQEQNGGNGPLPPRRNSRRIRAPTNGSAAGYDAANAYAGSAPLPSNAEEWRDRGAAVGARQETDSNGQVQTRVVKKGVKDFNFGRTLGEGSYSTVLAATDRQNQKEYAIKVLDKRHIIKEKKVKYVNIERDTLNRLTEHPGIVRLYYTFQDERSLYFVLDLASGGELLGVLKKLGSFDIECTQFYGAQILDSVAYMHSRGVIHRDLKPENVLLDRNMHTKITDFGTAKILPDPAASGSGLDVVPGSPTDGADNDRANSFVGTAEYVSPELLNRSNACKASDLWAFGCIIYQLIAGRPPFKAANEYLTFQKILSLQYTFPDGFPPAARDLVERLLVLDPAHRLPIEHIKNHEFFDGIQWGKNLWRNPPPHLKPYIAPTSTSTPIKLNGAGDAAGAAGAALANAAQQQASQSQVQVPQPRPQLRGVTDLPPPSQLDIDWSPVLTHNNERILKLGNLVICSTHQEKSPTGKNGDPPTPSEKPRFRLFGGNTAGKKRERLVLITSSARVIIAAAGGNDKKAKMDVNCLNTGALWTPFTDARGLTAFQIDTRERHITFEDPRATTADPAGSKYSTQEWLDALDNAKEIAIATSTAGSASYAGGKSTYSSVSSPADSMGADAAMPMSGPSAERHHMMRHTLRKSHTDGGDGGESLKGRKRFSKRHSKSGLAAVF
ncbi:serine/threonine protein kinase [Saxophila tyrrhenica]|uniref:non-specific serine/threonine protein kinase n=1 Tax=Saxophila tyrrhenica TaxID=1690608 RepID=A0AAV9PSR4_9PEZI|nr:serine/threonine protein kinase [Saxophila tyrrhenica]